MRLLVLIVPIFMAVQFVLVLIGVVCTMLVTDPQA